MSEEDQNKKLMKKHTNIMLKRKKLIIFLPLFVQSEKKNSTESSNSSI